MKMLDEFKAFAIKGNAVDLAVGVVIGAAFGKVVSSLVSDLITPVIGLLTGGVDFSNKVIVLKQATAEAVAVTLNYGSFITSILDFVIIAFAIFMVVRYVSNLSKKEEESPTEPPKVDKKEELLREIRDSLKRG
ncbi:MAG: large conductance mechanosensitive channel [Candidatus Paceibacteria bacterium]|jgi:large conductance mechanosensitive channel